MRLLPRLRRKDPSEEVKEEMTARKRALKDLRTRRRVGTPTQRQNITNVPDGAVVFQRRSQDYEEPVEETELDTPPAFLRKPAESGDTAEPEFELGEESGGLEQPAVEGALEGPEPEPAPAPDGGGGDLLDLFREEKSASANGGLASEVEDVSIADLMSDLSSISSRLGVKPRPAVVRQVVVEAAPAEVKAKPIEPEVKIEKIVPVPPVIEEDGIDDIDVGALLEPEPEPEPPQPPVQPRPKAAPPAPRSRGLDGGTLMHLLILGVALTAAGLFGASRIHRAGALAEATSPDNNGMAGIVLAVVETPGPAVSAMGTKAPSPSPTPEPTPAPTPTPVPAPSPKPVRTRDPSIPPAFKDYEIQYGDTLTSIAQGFGICPDHILWANGMDENSQLIAGEYLTIPDGPGVVHTVAAGDTLQSIARLYNSTVDQITGVAGNQVQSSDDLIVGDQIFVPNGIPQSALDMGAKADTMMSKPSADGLVWPFYGPITTYFGEQRVGYVHNAIDIGGLGHYGASVVAVAAGTVSFVGNDSEYGNNVIVQHADGSRTRYAHFSATYVEQGQTVAMGQPLGALGCSGDSTGTHLHFELWRDGKPVDPLLYLS